MRRTESLPGTYSIAEWAVFALLRVATSLTRLTGMSLLVPGLASLAYAQKDPRIAAGVAVALRFAVVFVAAGLVAGHLTRSSRAILPNEREARGERASFGGWLFVLAATLLALPVAMFLELAPLRALWHEMVGFLRAHEVLEQAMSTPEMSALILMPVVAALAIPLVQLATAAAFAAGSALCLLLLLTRSFRFPRAYLICLVMQAGLVVTTLHGCELAEQVSAWALGTIRASGEAMYTPEAVKIIGSLRHFDAVIHTTGDALLWTLGGYLLWVPLLLTSPRVRETFVVVTDVATVALPGVPAGVAGLPVNVEAASLAATAPVSATYNVAGAHGGTHAVYSMPPAERRKFYEEAARALQSGGSAVPQQTIFTAAFTSALIGGLLFLFALMEVVRHAGWWRHGG